MSVWFSLHSFWHFAYYYILVLIANIDFSYTLYSVRRILWENVVDIMNWSLAKTWLSSCWVESGNKMFCLEKHLVFKQNIVFPDSPIQSDFTQWNLKDRNVRWWLHFFSFCEYSGIPQAIAFLVLILKHPRNKNFLRIVPYCRKMINA